DRDWSSDVCSSDLKFLTHLPGTQLITVDRRADKDEAYAYLDDVAAGKMIILAPDGSTVPSNLAATGGEPYFKPYPDWQSAGTPAWGGYWAVLLSVILWTFGN